MMLPLIDGFGQQNTIEVILCWVPRPGLRRLAASTFCHLTHSLWVRGATMYEARLLQDCHAAVPMCRPAIPSESRLASEAILDPPDQPTCQWITAKWSQSVPMEHERARPSTVHISDPQNCEISKNGGGFKLLSLGMDF